MNHKLGILLINIGTPDAPTEKAVRDFLAEFLSDPQVVDYPRWLWMPILEKIILRKRPQKSALLYKKIWTASGSPLLCLMQSMATKLVQKNPGWEVSIGMSYGNPSIGQGLKELREKGVAHLVVFPLFPQYSSTTNLTAILKTKAGLAVGSGFKSVTIIKDYHNHPAYISALAGSLQDAWALTGKPEKTLFSFHGVPKRYITRKGEPYQTKCYDTSSLVSQKAGLQASDTDVAFQSRFGPEAWLDPYTDNTIKTLGEEGCKNLHVLCPGFAVDCLETLEEIAIHGKDIFSQAGGGEFHYIPALNDSDSQIRALAEIIKDSLSKAKRKG